MSLNTKESTGVWVNVVSYNRLPLLKKCIQALRDQTVAPARIQVVDNGSTDGTMGWLLDQVDDQVCFLEQRNAGSAGGQFTGVQAAYDGGAEWIWLMDDDVMPESTALEELLKARNEESEAALFCSRVTDAEGRVEVNTPVKSDAIQEPEYYPQWTRTLAAGLMPIERCTFVSCLVRAEVLPEIGLPQAEYFIWQDDYEFTRRISKRYPAYLAGKSVVRHMRPEVKRLSYKYEVDAHRIDLLFYFFRNKVHRLRREADHGVAAVWACGYFYVETLFGIVRLPHRMHLLRVFHKGFWVGLFFSPPLVKPLPRNHKPSSIG